MSDTAAETVPASLRESLVDIGQAHVLSFLDRLHAEEAARFVVQLESIDLARLPELIEVYVKSRPGFDTTGKTVEPPNTFALNDRSWDRAAMCAVGEELLRAGKVAAFTVAGGQGSRLGYDGPKGCFPGGAVTGKPLFAMLAEWITWARRDFGAAVPWYIMTSPLNHDATIAFFREHHFFGLPEGDVMFFPQGTMPSFAMETGKMLLASPGELATNPDGHGGSLRALHTSGAIENMKERGVEQISYVQVDNPLSRVIDPVFIGLHVSPGSSGRMSTKVIAKTEPGEKVGVIALIDGTPGVIEYSDLPAELAEKRVADGSLELKAGNIALHMISVSFVESLNAGGSLGLPFHRAEKKIPCVDLETGETVSPNEPNGIKLEMFVFDALPMAGETVVYEVDRVDEFAPIKNAEGKDSPASCAELQTERAARWLEANGVTVPRKADGSADCVLEISPLTATLAGELGGKELPKTIEAGARLAL